jgi:hypothetical protein
LPDLAPLLVQEGLGVVRCDYRQPPPDPLLNKGGGAVIQGPTSQKKFSASTTNQKKGADLLFNK